MPAPGGCALAYRLAALSDATIVVLEAGGAHEPAEVRAPSRWPETMGGDIDWNYQTVPQQHTDGRVHPWPRGKIVGGTTCLNAMVFQRPSASDFATWGPGWKFDDVLPTFRALEHTHGPAQPWRGNDGPLHVGPAVDPSRICTDFVEACVEANHPRYVDFNDPECRGAGLMDLAVFNKTRQSAARAFMERALQQRGRVELVADATATRIEIDDDGRATAVHYRGPDGDAGIEIGREVILCAGAIESPKLLMLSGIGPAAGLRAAGIEPRLENESVGQNLQDHLALTLLWSTQEAIAPPNNQFVESGLLVRDDERWPEAQLVICNGNFVFDIPGLAPPPGGIPAADHAMAVLVGLLNSKSHGSLRLDPDDPAASAIIDPRYMSDPGDLEKLLDGVEVVREIVEQSAMARWGLHEVYPGAATASRSGLADFARAAAGSCYHPVGTCALGDGPEAVVDLQLKVHETANVRVADASVIPHIPSAGPTAACYMIGWRAAELLLV